MVNMCAAANLHQSRIPAPAAVCVRSRPANAGHAEALAIFPRSSQFFCSYVGKSDSQSVLVRIEVMGAEGSDFVSLL
jgi:hypothetical protein